MAVRSQLLKRHRCGGISLRKNLGAFRKEIEKHGLVSFVNVCNSMTD